MLRLDKEFDQNLENSTILCVFKAGSHLYGNTTEYSDIDWRGIFIPNKNTMLSLFKNIDIIQRKNGIDFDLYSISKFFKLATLSNPTLIEYFFVPDNMLEYSSRLWEYIRDHRHLFISNRVQQSFFGYAKSQLKRIRTHRNWLISPPKKKPERKDYGLPPLPEINKSVIGAFNSILIKYLRHIVKFHNLADSLEKYDEGIDYASIITQNPTLDFNDVNKIIPLDDNIINILNKENNFKQDLNNWNNYQNWKNTRNPSRAELEEKYGYDTKHASHLIRLLMEAAELLTTGKIIFPLVYKEFLTDIRNGYFTFDTLIEEMEKLDSMLKDLSEKSVLPNDPKINKIDELYYRILEHVFYDKSLI